MLGLACVNDIRIQVGSVSDTRIGEFARDNEVAHDLLRSSDSNGRAAGNPQRERNESWTQMVEVPWSARAVLVSLEASRR